MGFGVRNARKGRIMDLTTDVLYIMICMFPHGPAKKKY